MKVVSFVPSWTETLIWAGVDVIGRTRFCIHPNEKVTEIPQIGGTKEAHWEKVLSLHPDIVLFDREENTAKMAKDCPVPWQATHVKSIEDMPQELRQLAKHLGAPRLIELAERWQRVLERPLQHQQDPPGLIEWERRSMLKSQYQERIYVIWAHPWMAATENTFIGSLMKHLGWSLWTPSGINLNQTYPQFDPKIFSRSLFLCSSEPYPFLKRRDVLKELPGDVALVDGEKLSWFGIRSLQFMESLTL